jgi:hypothetical protein
VTASLARGGVVGGNNAAKVESSNLVAGIAGSLAALAAIAALLMLFLIKRRHPPDAAAGFEDEMDQSEGVDATTFSSDDAFVSEYGFSDRGGDSHGGGEPSDDNEILVSEYGVSEGDARSPGPEGAIEDIDDSLGDDNEPESTPDDGEE